MFEVMMSSRHDHADDDVDDEQQDAKRAPHARLFTLSPSVPDRLPLSRASRSR
jgi:hypothetical protein